jgi:hypothetical protein
MKSRLVVFELLNFGQTDGLVEMYWAFQKYKLQVRCFCARVNAVLGDRINAQSCSYHFARREVMWGNGGMAPLILNLVLDGSE